MALVWGDVALAVARKAGSLVGQDISVRTTMDAPSAPKCDPSAAQLTLYNRGIKRALSATLQPFQIHLLARRQIADRQT